MSVPPQHRTSSHKRRRAAHFALKPTGYSACPKCNKPIRPHQACAGCGTYKGRVVLNVNKKIKKATKKAKA